MESGVISVIKRAIQEKKKEIAYYRKAAGKSKNPNADKVFTYLAEQEESHLATLKEHLSSAGSKETWLSDESLFSRNACKLRHAKPKSVIPSKVKAGTSDLDALRQAIGIEKKAIESYTDAACSAKDAKAARVLHYLAESEKEHLKELELQYAFLKSEGFWYDNEVTPT
jgi:rubrerythrin